MFGNGGYCGSGLPGGDPNTLYQCVNRATQSKTPCPLGCHPAPPHMNDYCNNPNSYHLPWTCHATYRVTQGNNGDICGSNMGDHTGVQAYAWDFGLPRHTAVRAARGGTVTVAANVVSAGHACYDGCTQPYGSAAFWQCCNGCINTSNHVNIDHGDGTVATYWHLDMATVSVGAAVAQGDVIGYSGTSGCSSGPHLHYMVMGHCPTGYCQSVSTSFVEAGIPACGQSVTSQNCP
jgi:murein DD-endopeptidase MepM/ murein hydrolase activator NlpD